MAGEIDGDGLVARRQVRHLRVPVGVRAGKAVHEHDGRSAFAVRDVMDERHFLSRRLVGD